jgi:hypothetical protein
MSDEQAGLRAGGSLLAVAVLLMPAPSPEAEVRALLGPDRLSALRAELVGQAEAWSRELAGAALHRTSPGRSLAEAVGRLFAQQRGPVIVVWPVLPWLRAEHGAGTLDDLRGGADVVLGPLMGGGFYLLGFSRPLPELLVVLDRSSAGEDPTPAALAAAGNAGLDIGYLRPERALLTQADVAAALSDPLTPEPIRRILSPSS